MGDKFNNDLKQTIYDASRKYGDLEGVIKFLADYDNLKDKLPKGKSPAHTTPSVRLDIAQPVKVVKDYLAKVKKKFPEKYDGSYYKYTETIMDKIHKYQVKGERYPRLELGLLALLAGRKFEKGYKLMPDVPADKGLMKSWKKLQVSEVTKALTDIYDGMAPYADKETLSENDRLNPPKDFPLAPLEKEIVQLGKDIPEMGEQDIEMNKEIRNEKTEQINEVVKDVPADDKFKHALGFVDDYLAKAKKGFPKEFSQYSLHQYTANLVSAMKEYKNGKGRDAKTGEKLSKVFNGGPKVIAKWRLIHKPISKRLAELHSAFVSAVETKENAPQTISKDLMGKIETLSKKNLDNVPDDGDETIAKALIGDPVKKEKDPGVEFSEADVQFYNRLIKEMLKHKNELPKKPGSKDIDTLNLSDEDKKKAKEDETIAIISKVFALADEIDKEEKEVKEEDLPKEIIKRLKDKATKDQEKQKKDKEVVMDRDLKKEDESAKNKPEVKQKESSINIISNYRESLFYRLERMANLAEDKLIKAELENIVQDIKQIL